MCQRVRQGRGVKKCADCVIKEAPTCGERWCQALFVSHAVNMGPRGADIVSITDDCRGQRNKLFSGLC